MREQILVILLTGDRVVKFRETESRMEVARGQGEGKGRS